MKKIMMAFAGLALIGMSACDDDDGIDPNLPLRQDIRIEKYIGGNTYAFANFLAQRGDEPVKVRLDNGASITVNGQRMDYYDYGEYNLTDYDYYATVGNDRSFEFRFVRNDRHTYVNTISTDWVEAMPAGDVTQIKNGERVPFAVNLTNGSVAVYLLSSNASYQADAAMGLGYTFKDVPKGTYTLRITVSETRNVVQGDNNAGGTMTMMKITEKKGVTVI